LRAVVQRVTDKVCKRGEPGSRPGSPQFQQGALLLTNTLSNSATVVKSPLDAALEYFAAGQSVVPISPDGSKHPALPSWKEYQTRRADPDQLRQWFADGSHGPAIICGAISGNLELLDFDYPGLFQEWSELVSVEDWMLLQRLTVVETPHCGRHLPYRCHEITIPGSTGLAK